MALPARFRMIRHHFEQTVRGMSSLLGVSHSLWAQYEAGRKSPSCEVLQHLCALGISLDWLMTGDGDMLRDGSAAYHSRPLPQQPSVATLLTDISRLLQSHSGRRLQLWLRLMTLLNRRFEGYSLEALHLMLKQELTFEQLEHELNCLQAQGTVLKVNEQYRLIKASLKESQALVELVALISAKALLEEHLPICKQTPTHGKIIEQRFRTKRGTGAVQARSLGRMWEQWLLSLPIEQNDQEADAIQVVLSVVVQEGKDPDRD